MDKEQTGITTTVHPRLHHRSADVNVTRLLKNREQWGGLTLRPPSLSLSNSEEEKGSGGHACLPTTKRACGLTGVETNTSCPQAARRCPRTLNTAAVSSGKGNMFALRALSWTRVNVALLLGLCCWRRLYIWFRWGWGVIIVVIATKSLLLPTALLIVSYVWI